MRVSPRGGTMGAETSNGLTRRELIAGAGAAGAAALLLDPNAAQAQPGAGRPVVFTHTTVVGVDNTRDDVALAIEGDKIAAIGSTDDVLKKYANADVYDGRGKAI